MAFWSGCGEHTSTTLDWSALQLYLKLNETTTGTAPGGKDFVDSSPNGNHGSKNNGITINQSGKLGRSVKFSSDGLGYISASVPGINASNGQQVTVMFWMNWSGSTYAGNDWAVALSFSSLLSLTFNISTSSFGFCTYSNDVYGISSTGLAPNTWYHVTAIIKNGTMTANKLYINGVPQTLSQQAGSPTNSANKATSSIYIGNLAGGDTFPFQGMIDDVAVFNGALSNADIQAIYSRENSLMRSCP